MLIVTLKVLSVYSLLSGFSNIIRGFVMYAEKAAPSATTAVLDSQLRYQGATIAASGAICWWVSDLLPERQVPLAILGVMVVVGGMGRALSAWQYGFGAPWTRRAMWVELVAPIGVWGLWMVGI